MEKNPCTSASEMQSSCNFSPVRDLAAIYNAVGFLSKHATHVRVYWSLSFQLTCVFPMIRRLRRVVLLRSPSSRTQVCLKVSACVRGKDGLKRVKDEYE